MHFRKLLIYRFAKVVMCTPPSRVKKEEKKEKSS